MSGLWGEARDEVEQLSPGSRPGVGAGRGSWAQVELVLQRPSGRGWLGSRVGGGWEVGEMGKGLREPPGQGAPQHLTEPWPAEEF